MAHHNARSSQSSQSSHASRAGFSQLPHHLIDRGVLNGLKPSALRVLLLMLRMADGDGRCWPSQRAIAARTGMRTRSVQTAIKSLLASGLVHRERHGCSGQTTLYRLQLVPPTPTTAAARSDSSDDSPGQDQRPNEHAVERAAESADEATCASAASSALVTRSSVRDKAHKAAQSGRTPLRTNKNQDQDTQPTTSRVRGESVDVCVRGSGEGTSDVAAGASARDAIGDSIGDSVGDRASTARKGMLATMALDPDAGPASIRLARLGRLGIRDETAMNLLATYPPQRIDCALDNAEFLADRRRVSNAAGYVIDALRRKYGPLAERMDAQRVESKRRTQRDAEQHAALESKRKAERDERLAEQSAADALRVMRGMADAALADAVKRTLEAQPACVRAALGNRDPRTSRNLAMLVRDHLDNSVAPPMPR